MQVSFLLTLLAAKGLGALIGGLILLTRTVPGFASPDLAVEADSVRLRTRLAHAFNRQLDQLLESGSNVAVGYTVEFLERGATAESDRRATVHLIHSAVYDPGAGTFTVYRSELGGSTDSLLTVETLTEAKELLAGIEVALSATAELVPGRLYAARVQAALNTIHIEAMDDQELDLNSLWNYRYPVGITPWTGLPPP